MLKKILTGLFTGVIIFFSSVGGYTIYKNYQPTQLQEIKTELVKQKFKSIGTLKVGESTVKYKKTIQKGKIFKNTLHLILTYESFSEYDLKDIIINENIQNKEVFVFIEKSKLKISPIRLINNESFYKRGMVSRNLSVEELRKIKKEIEEEVIKSFKNDNNFIQQSFKSLEKNLTELIEMLGFENIHIIFK